MQPKMNFINGKWITSKSGRTYEHRNPANLQQVTGIWQYSSAEDVQEAIDAAQNAFDSWRSLTVYQRAEYLKRALELTKERVISIADVITTENGKTIAESKSEIFSAIKEMEFQINQGLRTGGQVMPCTQSGVLAYSIRCPLGPVAVIAPWNFPFNVLGRKCLPALVTGNTCVLKPANLTPGVGEEFVKLFNDAGLPSGVLNFVTGSGREAGNELVVNPKIRAVSFTGSTEIGMNIQKCSAPSMKRTQLEMGGKNPLIVLADADLEKAADSVALAAYACAGQWCTSTSRAIVEKSVMNDFLDILIARIKRIIVGPGTDPNITMGPVCGENQLNGILTGIAKGKAEGAIIVSGGHRLMTDNLQNGCFVEPTVFSNVTPEMFLAQEEIFGPVLSVMTAEDFEHTIQLANNVRFGLSSSIYTNDLHKAMTFVNRTNVGLTHVNMPTAVKEPQLSFGGVKTSGFGIPEAGKTGIEFFTEHKVVYINYQ